MRRAIFVQVKLATVAPQQLAGGSNNFVGADSQHAGIGLCAAGVCGWADRAAQHDAASPEWPVAHRIGGAEDCNHGDSERRSEVHGARIAADEKARASRKSN